MAEESDCGNSLIKKLASCDKTVRDRSLRTVLQTWLPNQTEVSDEDMKKLWQGLFYCMWHADKFPYQSELIDRLSSAVQSLPLPISIQYFTVFLFTMRREWSRIDRLRLDKFYLLIRRFLQQFFVLLRGNSWDLDFTRRLMNVLLDGTFLANDKFQASGFNYHIASIFIAELRPFLPLSKEALELLFSPFVALLGFVNDKVLVLKIKSDVFDELLKMGKKLLDVKKSEIELDSNDDALVLGSIALSMGFSKKFYDLGSSPDCRQGNRKSIFSLHEEFSKSEKELSSSGVDISIPEISSPDDEVPDLIPVPNGVDTVDSEPKSKGSNGSSSKKKGLKKCTKESSGKKSSKKNKKEEAANVTTEDASKIEISDRSEEETHQDNDLISNLQMQFEKVAADIRKQDEIVSACDETEEMADKLTVSKKRKRKIKKEKGRNPEEVDGKKEEEAKVEAKSEEKSTKRVKFSMKNNIVWKPHCPLPPQSLRLPPSVTPRGSALKKGIPAGPIREIQSPRKKMMLMKKNKKAKKMKMKKKAALP